MILKDKDRIEDYLVCFFKFSIIGVLIVRFGIKCFENRRKVKYKVLIK